MTLGNRKLFKALLVFLAMHSAEEISAFTIAPTIHQKVTIEALSESNFNYLLPNGSLLKFSNESLSWIAVSNADIDILSLKDERFAEDYHFDDERFALGQDLLVKTRNLIILQLNDSAFSKSDPSDLLRQTELSLSSRELLGNALHTLQDYYSHSNWVEQQLLLPGNPKMNPALGVKGKQLETPANAVCSDGAPGKAPHTSGDYLATGIFDCAHICSAREGKCAHGNVLSPEPISSVPPLPPLSELMIACPWDWALVEPQCGINKDRGFRDGHAPAYELAKQHTSLFVAEIFNEALNKAGPNKNFVALGICQFMGVPNPIATCLTSHTITVQKLNKANGQPTLEGLVESSGNTITPAINCGSVCEGTAIAGTTVVLTARYVFGWTFVRWAEGGACAGSTDPRCSFVVDSNETARAEFRNNDFGFEVAETSIPWDPSTNPRFRCIHFEGEYLITGYYASFDRCYSNMDAVIRCVGAGCSASRFKVALIKMFWSATVVGGGADCNSYQDFLGAGSGQIYPISGGWSDLGQGWTRPVSGMRYLSPLFDGSPVHQNFRWIGADPGVPCIGSTTATMELEFNVYDVDTGNYTVIPFVMTVP